MSPFPVPDSPRSMTVVFPASVVARKIVEFAVRLPPFRTLIAALPELVWSVPFAKKVEPILR